MRIIHKIRSFLREIKWFIQRGKRGYADSDLWDLYWYISNLIVDALKEFDKRRGGHPGYLTDKKWSEKLNEMREGFEFYKNVDDIESEAFEKFGDKRKAGKLLWLEDVEKQRKIAEKKLNIFIKYFEHLWD